MKPHRAGKAHAPSTHIVGIPAPAASTPPGRQPAASQVAPHAPTRLTAAGRVGPYTAPVSPSALLLLGAGRQATPRDAPVPPTPQPLQVAPPPCARPASPHGDAVSICQEHGAPHDIVAGDRRLVANALFAEMDEGLVVARAGSDASGVCSTGFACCAALVFRKGDAVGLEHTSWVDVEEAALDARQEFEKVAADAKGVTRIAIGYSTAGYRADLAGEIDHLTLPVFWRGRPENQSAAQRKKVPATKEDAIRTVLDRHVRRIEDAARRIGAATFDMPHGMLFMPTQGSVRVFDAEREEPQIVPVRE